MSEKVKVLIYEKNQNLGHLFQEFLQMKEFEVDLFSEIDNAVSASTAGYYNIALLDIDGTNPAELELGRALKERKEDIVVIYLASSPEKQLAISAFQAGADDYMRKPFSLEELEARIHAILWRLKGEKSKDTVYYQIGNLLFDTRKQTLTSGDVVTSMTTKECDLLTLLCQHANKVVERSFALRAVWKDDSYFSARSMDVYITKVRKLLKADPNLSIVNIHGHGYKLITRNEEM